VILDLEWVINQDPDTGSGMNIPDRISESLEKEFFGLKIQKFFDAEPDLGSGFFLPRIRYGKIRNRDKHPRSATLISTSPICLL
jgi:hypothetical protein